MANLLISCPFLVLRWYCFLLGIIGWLVINANKLGDYFKENIEVRASLRGDLNPKDSLALMEYISSKPYVSQIEFITKDEAKERYLGDGNEELG